jgi:hypothetical protein
MSLSPDVEKGSQFPVDIVMASDDAVGRRRVSPPAPNRRKVSGHEESSGDEITAGWLQDNDYLGDSTKDDSAKGYSTADNKSYLGNSADKKYYREITGTMHRQRLSPRAAYGWLHAQSGYIFLLVVFLAFLRAGLHAAAPPPSAALAPPPPSSFTARAKSWLPALGAAPALPHPVPGLMDAADARFRAKLARQSPDLPAAVAEYTRRYARAPPRGFDGWYAYARAHGFVMVDEFDAIAEDLAPFWEMGGEELRERARVVGGLPSVDLVRVRGGKAETVKGGDGRFVDSEVSARAAGFKAMLTKFVKEVSCGFFLGPTSAFFLAAASHPQALLHPSIPTSLLLPSLANTSNPPAPRHGLPHQRKSRGPRRRPLGAQELPQYHKGRCVLRASVVLSFLSFFLLRVFFFVPFFLVFWTRRFFGWERDGEFAFCAFGTDEGF